MGQIQERTKFELLRRELAAKTKHHEETMMHRHSEIMARLMVERERKLDRMRQTWRLGVQVSYKYMHRDIER
jgi:hypothetical protein